MISYECLARVAFECSWTEIQSKPINAQLFSRQYSNAQKAETLNFAAGIQQFSFFSKIKCSRNNVWNQANIVRDQKNKTIQTEVRRISNPFDIGNMEISKNTSDWIMKVHLI